MLSSTPDRDSRATVLLFFCWIPKPVTFTRNSFINFIVLLVIQKTGAPLLHKSPSAAKNTHPNHLNLPKKTDPPLVQEERRSHPLVSVEAQQLKPGVSSKECPPDMEKASPEQSTPSIPRPFLKIPLLSRAVGTGVTNSVCREREPPPTTRSQRRSSSNGMGLFVPIVLPLYVG
ncbi:hypothetical protein CEXT_709101 [Caerostris extrusa]|uniref:Uncharacterized protein n=1 Tax=Caerostris extrusa TaxID=172846 RepID=A0AAV4VZ79_CAEEX|nr:hypothetical protein CEXT_709101 [Caerostris extrusa]